MTTGLRVLAVAAILAAPLFFLAPSVNAYTSTTGVVTSFDGTPIVYVLHLPAGADATHPVPVVLRTHGWGGQREATPEGTSTALLDAGYAILSWDARGFGQSGNATQLDSPDYEVKDTLALLAWAAAQPAILKDATGVVAAMSGVSYAGGIQLLTSALDGGQIRAIAPEITWNDLRYSLGPNGVVKNQWIQLLFWSGAASTAANGMGVHRGATSTSPPSQNDVGFGPAGPQTGAYDTNLPTYFAETMATNAPSQDTLDALWYRAPERLKAGLTTPTLFIQGWPDSLFVPNEAVKNYQDTLANGADSKLILYCGGHAGCTYTDGGERAHLDEQIVAWFDKHVKGLAVDTGAAVEWYSSDDALHAASAWPIPGTTYAHASGSGTILALPVPTAGGLVVQSSSAQAARDPLTSFRVPIAVAGSQLTGIGHVTVDVSAAAPIVDGTLFFRLVDTTTNGVIDGQTTPLRIGGAGVFDVDLVGVSYDLHGHGVALEVATNDAAFLASRAPGVMTVQVLDVSVPQL